MKRSERLAREGKIEVYIGSCEVAHVIHPNELQNRPMRYLCTDFEALYDGQEVQADVYEDELNDTLCAVITF
jgi:hypothetical protein